jgi:GTPase SAR1 family protein
MKEKASNENDMKKMLLMGLDKGGKSSIVLCLKGFRNIASFNLISPTVRIKRDNFGSYGSELNVWDFGGQEQFRMEYLLNFNKYILGTNKIIFVIDIQDTERYSLALNYLMEIVNKLQEHKINLDFSIFCHKYDPDMELINKSFDENKADAFIEEIKRKMPNNFKYEIAKTSIYSVFQKTNIL